ncbi:MAG: LLM class flavin-dependent oxidoreductase [Actinobacteria bacterium]|nr:LLM class flavin-dependent oxidoreductase [Actinomycetota bacterium]
MKVGVIVPQGWVGEYDGWDAARAWQRTVEVAKSTEELGFESIWVFDHFQTVPEPTEEITFESFSSLSALGAVTHRVRLGHVVICAGFRNPALTAKMISTMDVQTGGRMELGIGAGWKRDEWEAYGYGFPETKDRLKNLSDQLEVISRMIESPRATYRGKFASVENVINVPLPLQKPRMPIMVGGNGPEVTWRLAARFADELNVDGMLPPQVAEALPVIAARCEEIDRDPESLRVSVHMWRNQASDHGQARVERLAAYRTLGVSRVMGFISGCATSDEALEAFAADCRAAGAEME